MSEGGGDPTFDALFVHFLEVMIFRVQGVLTAKRPVVARFQWIERPDLVPVTFLPG